MISQLLLTVDKFENQFCGIWKQKGTQFRLAEHQPSMASGAQLSLYSKRGVMTGRNKLSNRNMIANGPLKCFRGPYHTTLLLYNDGTDTT